MTSTGTFKGFQDGSRNSSKVLKPPGGGSSDIFGSAETVDSPRRVKQNHNQSQLGSNFFGDHQQQNHHQPQQKEISSNGSSAPETPRSKPGNDSHERLFGPPDAPPPATPNSKYHMRSSISLSSDIAEPNLPARCFANGSNESLANGNGNSDITGGSSCMPRNPVTGDGVDVKPHASRRIVRRNRDGNPVTGAGYDSHANNSTAQQNGNGVGGDTPSIGSDKSSTDSSPSAGGVTRMKNRVPPGGYSSGLW